LVGEEAGKVGYSGGGGFGQDGYSGGHSCGIRVDIVDGDASTDVVEEGCCRIDY
jgi:hypothetical protein